MPIYHVSQAHQPPQDNICHEWANRKSLGTHRSFSGRKQLLHNCFFTANKKKTNPLPLATKDLSERWTFHTTGCVTEEQFTQYLYLCLTLNKWSNLFFLSYPNPLLASNELIVILSYPIIGKLVILLVNINRLQL